MKNLKKVIKLLAIIPAVILFLSFGCTKDDPARSTTYDLKVKDVLGVSGTVKFTETSSTKTTIDLMLTNAPAGTHPANLYMYSAVEQGAVVIALNPVDATGKSSTETSTMTYSQLIVYDGCVKVQKSDTEVILAQGDIGGNVLTTTNKTYQLKTAGVFGVSGTALFEKRVNGNTLVTVSLVGIIPGEVYPSTINLGTIETVGGGDVKKTMSNVNGTTGKGFTNIRTLDSGVKITYDDWLVYAGYINVYQAPIGLTTIICQGNIGSK